MTLVHHAPGRALQLAGLIGVSFGAIAAWMADGCGGQVYALALAVGAGLDVACLAIRPGVSSAIALSILKGIVVVAPMTLFISCGAPRVPLPIPIVDGNLASTVVIASAVSSLLGSILLRFAR